MAKRLNYEVGFTAETSELNAALHKIQNDLSKISLGKTSGTSITSEINEAADAAARLNLALKNAINVDTGRLDLSKFAEQLRSSGLTLDQYRQKLNLIGASGTEAFMNVAKVITQAELPMARSNKLLDSLWTTMKNTARWQLTSSALHGFMGGLQTCYGYAQDLNSSLNNIRIVSGQSSEQMAEFARRANDAAKALSSTTTSYTDAALIYYQQGLRSQEDIEGRTNTTIKMANVTQTAAKEVSDQMTAIWNNFYDGSKSLEYYADVITALGAETASSSAEISAGLEKFAAIAGSVGLSYEYATSALATVTATTRQSADVVGTAFKTLFARIQGLNLGETLDDGTTLNKYSEALFQVGINIKDQYGQLKDMDVILDEMASKWGTLSKDQQLALAQTVAGVRQYNQLVALMDNWDFMQENLQTAKGSSGTLQKQANTYAESWEAARDRVRAAAEDVYSSLVNEDFFIGLDNSIVGVLERVDDAVDAMGGFSGVLITVGTLMTSVYGDRMAQGIRNMAYNVSYLMGIEQARAVELKKAATAQLEQMASDLASPELIGIAEAYRRQAEAQIELNDASKQLTSFQQEQLQQEVQLLNLATQRTAEYGKSALAARERLEILRDTVAQETQYSQQNFSKNVQKYDAKHGDGSASALIKIAKEAANITGQINDSNVDKLINKYGELRTRISQISTVNRELAAATQSLQTAQNANSSDVDKLQQKVQLLRDRLIELGSSEDSATQDVGEMNNQVRAIVSVLTNFINLTRDGRDALTEMGQAAQQAGINTEKSAEADRHAAEAKELLDAKLKQLTASTGDWASKIVGVANTAGQLAMAFNAVKSIGRVFSDEDMTAAERFTTILMSLSMILPLAAKLMQALTAAESKNAVVKTIVTAATAGETVVLGTSIPAKLAAAAANKILATSEGAVATGAQMAGASLAAQLIMMAPYIALVAALAVGIYALAKAYNADADAAKKAEEVSNDLADAAQEATDRLNNIKSAIDGYDSAVEKLNECTEGTQEWNEALAEVQKQIDDIITKFPELLKEADLFNTDGTFNEDVLDRVVERAESANQAAQAANLQGQVAAAQARLKSDTTNASRQYENYTEAGSYNTGYTDLSYHSVRSDLDKLVEQYDNVGSTALELTDVYNILGNVTDEYAQHMYNLAKNSIDATTMLDNANQLMIKTWAESHEEDLVAGQAELMAAKQQEYYDTFAEAFEAASDQNNKINNIDYSKLGAAFNGTQFEGMSVTQAFNAARGTNYQLAGNGVRGTDNNRSYVYLENGQEAEYKMEEMQATVAAAAALEKMGQSADETADILGNLRENVGSDIATGIQNYLASGNFESMSQTDFNAMQAGIEAAGGADAYLQNALGMTGEEIAQVLGEDYLDDFTTAADNYSIAFDTFKNNLLKSVQNAYDELDSDKLELSVSGQKAIAQAMEDAMVYGGKEGLETVQSTIDALDADNIEGFSEVLKSMDWDAQGPEEFINALDEAEVETGLTTEQLTAFGNAMTRVANSKDFSTLSEKYAEISKAIKGLETGDTITADKYEKLGELGESYFTKMLDGTYKLTADAEEFYRAVQEQQISEYKELQNSYRDEISNLQGISGYDMNNLSQTSLYTNDEGQEVYSTQTLKEQLEILEAMNYNAEELARWKEDLYDDGDSAMNTQSLQDIADAVAGVNEQLGENGLTDKINALNGAIYEIDLAVASSYDSFRDLHEAFEEGQFGVEAYNAALINLDKQLDTQDLDIDEWEDYADHLQDIAEDVENLSDELADNDAAAKIVAKSIMKMNDGIDALADGYDDWVDVLKNSSSESQEFSDAILGMRDALANVLDISDQFISDDFIISNLDLIKEAATGSAEAIDQLKQSLLEDVVARITVDNQLEGYDLLGAVNDLQAQIEAMGPLEVGATIDDQGFIDACNEIVNSAGLTADQANALFDTMGFETNFETVSQPVKKTGHGTRTVTELKGEMDVTMPDGTSMTIPAGWETKTYPGEAYDYVDYVDAVAMTTDGSSPKINSITKKATGSFNNYSSSNKGGKSPGKGGGSKGGGGGGKEDKPKKKDETVLDDVLDRYHEINDQIDDVTRATKKLNTETDRLYGAKKFANMDKEIKKLKEQNKLLEEKTKQAKNYLGTIDSGDMGALVKAAAGVGFTLDSSNFDAAGNLLNVEEIQRTMWNKIHEMEVEYNSKATGTEQDTYEEEVIKPWQDKVDEFERALKLYEETRELIQDLEEERESILREIEDIRFKKIVESIEIRLDYKDAKKDINELAKIIRQAVGTAYDWGKDVAGIDFKNMELEKSKMSEYQEEYQKLMELYEESKTNSAISTEDIAKQLETLRGQIIDSTEALVEWAESLEHVLPDAIDAAREHFDQFIDQLEHNTKVIDTIKEIMVLQGLTLKTAQGFNDIQDMHQKRMDATLGQAILNRKWYERAAKQLEEAQAQLDAAPRDTEQYDILKANRDALLQEYNDAQEAMLESAKETMEEARDMYVDAVERTAYELEQTLTKGQGFDLLQDKYDHYLDTEERYLDTVNRIYETTTLNNKLQKEIDKTTNAAGAAKLRELQEEFKLRQANNKLSQYDIDVMNAKLELTLKQMALEEAQNSKTDLRLVRNAQGNWNYQYTANQDDVDAANQDYLDAMNEYYNLAKNRVKDVTGQIIDTWKEMTEKIKEIYEDETLTVEEREARIAEIREYYSQKVKDLEEEKQKAIVDMTEAGQMAIDDFKDRHKDVLGEMGDDVDNLRDIFSDDLADILEGADNFSNQFAIDMDDLSKEVTDFDKVFDDTINNMEDAAKDYQDTIEEVNTEVGVSYDDLKGMLDEVAESTDEVTNRGLEETDMMWDKLGAIQSLTQEYAAMADAILQAADAMRDLAQATMELQYNDIGGQRDFDKNTDYSALMSSYLKNGGSTTDATYLELLRQRNSKIDWLQTDEGGNKTSDYWGTYGQDTTDMFNQLVQGGGNQDWYKGAASMYEDTWRDILKRLTGFATGGYTGDFEDGKLAILHEKELVLNAKDTSNILAAVNTVRDLDSSIWSTAVKNLDTLVAQSIGMMMGRLSSALIPNNDNQVLEQRITIEHIEFPEATDKNEILEALHSLPDMASQWARIKKD